MSPLLYQLSYTARKDGTEPGEMIQECSGECLARITHEGSSQTPVRTGWLLGSVWFVSFVWLNKINSMN
jgi:hypothetical protein